MVTSKELGDEVGALLAGDGFRKRAGTIFTVELADDVLGWLGLNEATQHTRTGEIEVNPVLGLRHQSIERTVARLRDDKFHAYKPATVAIPLGHLMPENTFRVWLFRAEDLAATAQDLVENVREHGLPFLRRHATLAAITRQLESGPAEGTMPEYRLPVAYLLAGEHDRAMTALTGELDSLGDRQDAAADYYRRFAERFREAAA
ncbi:MAG: hypothetical protein ACRDSK_17190 [Actinophytocola sp.]|uniref:hypothetical protein n=1 Tax=Actinophytocola sp. TaxID=1872138 RepID=UPI003D6AA9F8